MLQFSVEAIWSTFVTVPTISVTDVIKILSAALEPDYVVLGGGNVRKMKKLPSGTERGNNDKAFVGGIRLWVKSRAHA
jgi:hypothetical protein